MHSLIVICGPSGIGKSFLKRKVLKFNSHIDILQTTTRHIRTDEVDGMDYFFTTNENITRNKLQYTGISNFNNCFYGFEKKHLINSLVIKKGLTVASLWNLQNINIPELVVIPVFLYPLNLDLIIERMKSRGETNDQILKRLKALNDELVQFSDYKGNLYRVDIEDDNIEHIVNFILTL